MRWIGVSCRGLPVPWAGAAVRPQVRVRPGRGPAAGDRPAGRGRRPRRPVPDPARHHRVGQVGHDRLGGRADAEADAGPRPQQGARRPAGQRVPPVLPRQPGGVLRQLLRLLPARGLHGLDRHVHREGVDDQRRDRPAPPLGDGGAAHPARRDHRRLGVGDLRPGLARAVRGPAPQAGPGGAAPPRLRRATPGRHPVRAQRGEPHPWPVPGEGGHPGGLPFIRGDGVPGRVLRRRGRAHPADEPGDRRGHRRAVRAVGAPGHPLRHRAGADAEGDRRHRSRAGRAAGGARAARQAARGPAAPDADQLRPRDDARDRDLCRDRELLAPPRRASAGTGPVHAARLLPRRLPHRPRREPRHHPADPRAVRRGPEQEGRAGRARLPPAQRRRQPAAHLRGVVPSTRHRRCSCRPPPPPGRSSTRARSSSRSSAPPGWSTLRWW